MQLRSIIYKLLLEVKLKACAVGLTKPQTYVVDSSMESPDETISSISNQIRFSISSWVNKQSDGTLQGLKENQHLQIAAKTLKLSNRISATIKCMLCNTTLQLQRNPNIPSSFILSNWTRHVKAYKQLTCMPMKCVSLNNFFEETQHF